MIVAMWNENEATGDTAADTNVDSILPRAARRMDARG